MVVKRLFLTDVAKSYAREHFHYCGDLNYSDSLDDLYFNLYSSQDEPFRAVRDLIYNGFLESQISRDDMNYLVKFMEFIEVVFENRFNVK